MPCESLTPERLADLSTRGPRYTSYPPATEMRQLDDAAVRPELARLAASPAPISLYAHIPFCRSLCAYCGCNVIPTRDRSRAAPYVDTLVTELALLASALGPGYPVAEVALGGGSPNFLPAHTIDALSTALRRYFAILPDARLSVELDPRTTTTSELGAFAAAGFRAASVGVQDFASAVQDAIRRHQSVAQTRWLIDAARAAGFTDVNIDIVYGLPHQTEETFVRTLDEVIALAPDRIALFGYAHLPDKLPHQRIVERSGRVLDRYERATLLLLGIQRLTGAGYIHLGLDHFARPGSSLARAAAERRMTRTFQGYVEHRADAILGVGTSAISSTPGLLWQSHSDLADWRAAVESGRLPVARGVALDGDDRVRRDAITQLMCDGELDLSTLGEAHHIDARAYFARELADLADLEELAHYEPDTQRIETTPLGRLLVRNVCMVFDRYHHAAGQFSSTI